MRSGRPESDIEKGRSREASCSGMLPGGRCQPPSCARLRASDSARPRSSRSAVSRSRSRHCVSSSPVTPRLISRAPSAAISSRSSARRPRAAATNISTPFGCPVLAFGCAFMARSCLVARKAPSVDADPMSILLLQANQLSMRANSALPRARNWAKCARSPASRSRFDDRSANSNAFAVVILHTFDCWQSRKSAATPVHLYFNEIFGGLDLKRLPWSATCLGPTRRGRAFGHTKSRWLFSLLGGAERRAGIIVLPPRSTFRQTHSTATTPRRARPTHLVDFRSMELGVIASRQALTLSDVRDRLAIVASHTEDVGAMALLGSWSSTRDAKLTDLLLTLYASAGSCSSLRTADGERPVQRTKA